MSMDVMGIKQEELIDGVKLGGVATFIGSGESSDISLFIFKCIHNIPIDIVGN